MAERFKAVVLKTIERKLRRFESCSLRHFPRTPFKAVREPPLNCAGTCLGAHPDHYRASLVFRITTLRVFDLLARYF